ARGILALTSVTAGTTPDHTIGLEYNRLDAMLLGQVQRRNQTGEARSDDNDIRIKVLCDGAIVLGRRAGRSYPVGRRISLSAARFADQLIIYRIINTFFERHRRRMFADCRDGCHYDSEIGKEAIVWCETR